MRVPADFRGPAREDGQILVDGIARRISLFMGKSDWELDWHIYLDLPGSVQDQLRRVGYLHPDGLFCEWMVVNRWEDELLGRQWWSEDMDQVLLLAQLPPSEREGGETVSEDWSLIEDDSQGGSATTVADRDDPATRRNSALVEHGARVYLQGAFVADAEHDPPHLEIHPLDSIAYSLHLATGGVWRVLSARAADQSWPDNIIRWRVAAFANSGFHRISNCGFVRKARKTTWYLDLPRNALEPESTTLVSHVTPGFWDSNQGRRVPGRGVQEVSVEPAASGTPLELSSFPIDRRDGRRKLKVEITMARPDERDDGWISGCFLRDFDLRVEVGPDSGPAVTGAFLHTMDVFVRGKDNHELVHRFFHNQAWSGWINLGGELASGPAVVFGSPHILDVFVRGKHNDELMHRSFDGARWSAWINLGGDLASAPSVAARGAHLLDVFIRGRHNHELVHRFFNGTTWSGWINLGGDLASGPAVVAGGPHVLDVFVRGKHNDDLVHRFFDGRKWSGWINLGGDLASRPAVTAKGPHVLDVFVRGKHNHELVHRFFDGTHWSDWINLGGDLASGPAVTAGGPHALDVFVRGKHNDELVHRFYDGGTWSGWINLGGDLA
jgi:hypothetical protein